eukprot:CAMPEP_0115118156 /NCGR_PEP_ID=MMETSP0227-20121206/44321_1 /TAXON_ID=89957 /ORGANISM="Polarella glacialis, Strain CCMP 1383" /LENGTH=37 /DNA_ID= /DNA_START= /DNA_END= /DNA_ORIENTATION=
MDNGHDNQGGVSEKEDDREKSSTWSEPIEKERPGAEK